MRIVAIIAAVMTLTACDRTPGGNAAAPAQNGAAGRNEAAARPAVGQAPDAPAKAARPASTAASYPEGFPSDDAAANGSACYLYLMLASEAPDPTIGFDGPAMEQAANQWRAQLLQSMSEQEVRQLTASETNFRLQTPAPERSAAARWCVDNAPEVDPEG